ncbi:MAG: DUF4230 domain-containing protein [Arachidicoccus sp.]|nr:DUF4230 domain-containing protein [Arachidicoccus sp.]
MKFRFSTAVLVLILVIIIGLLAYFLGKKNGSVKIENIATNEAFIKEISELSSLEIHGTATIKNTNIQNDGSISDNLKKIFLENTVNISVPYIAKYGVDLQQEKINLFPNGKIIAIHLPEPKLLSYELVLDMATGITKEGWFASTNTDYYNAIQASLYTQTKKQMESNNLHKKQTEDKIVSILKEYYKPLGYSVSVQFGDNENIIITKDSL